MCSIETSYLFHIKKQQFSLPPPLIELYSVTIPPSPLFSLSLIFAVKDRPTIGTTKLITLPNVADVGF